MRKRPIVQKVEEENSNEGDTATQVCKSACLSLWDSCMQLDHQLTTQLALCASKESSLGHLRPFMKILEISCHGIPWILGSVIMFVFSHKSEDVEVAVNLFFALMFDLVVVCILKMSFRRTRPSHNVMDMFAAPSVDKFSFPSGHATRAAMMGLFLVNHIFSNKVYVILTLIWSLCVSASRVLLGRHHIVDVLCGFFIGIASYNAFLYLWISQETCGTYLDSYFGHIHH